MQAHRRVKFTTPAGDLDNLAKPLLDVLPSRAGAATTARSCPSLTKRFPFPGEEPHIRFRINDAAQMIQRFVSCLSKTSAVLDKLSDRETLKAQAKLTRPAPS